jgi:hypothetical protein
MQVGTIKPKAPATATELANLLPKGATEVINGIVLYDVGDEIDVESIIGNLGWVEPGTEHVPQ